MLSSSSGITLSPIELNSPTSTAPIDSGPSSPTQFTLPTSHFALSEPTTLATASVCRQPVSEALPNNRTPSMYSSQPTSRPATTDSLPTSAASQTKGLNEHGKRVHFEPREFTPSKTRHSVTDGKPSSPPVLSTSAILGPVSNDNPHPPTMLTLRNLDFGTSVVQHDWWGDLVGKHADAESVRETTLTTQRQDALENTFGLYKDYRKAYTSYNMPVLKFLIACIYIHHTHIRLRPALASSDNHLPVHPYLWDDYIRCFTTRFPAYVVACQEQDRVPMTCLTYYNTRIKVPEFTAMVVTQSSLENFVRKDSVQWIYRIFGATATTLLADIKVSQDREQHIRLQAAASLKVMDQELAELDKKRGELGRRRFYAQKLEEYCRARIAGSECEVSHHV